MRSIFLRVMMRVRVMVVLRGCVVLWSCVVLWGGSVYGESDTEALKILEGADDWRQGREGAGAGEALRTEIVLKKEGKKGKKDREVSYRVWIRDRLSLVEMLDKRVFGQRVLMDEKSLWLFTPKSKRLVRVNPLQRLLGDASYGDIATTRWTLDYDANWEEERMGEWEERPVYNLLLTAKDRRTTYAKLKVKVDRETGAPLYAEAYVKSGKKLKTIVFGGRENVGDREVIRETIFRDALREGRETVMTLKSIKKAKFRDSYYTKQGMKARLPK